jgi:hypothetical protein
MSSFGIRNDHTAAADLKYSTVDRWAHGLKFGILYRAGNPLLEAASFPAGRNSPGGFSLAGRLVGSAEILFAFDRFQRRRLRLSYLLLQTDQFV